MLNIIKLIKKNEIIKNFDKRGEQVNMQKRDIALNKEWYNSVYVFNKNPVRFLPAIHEFIFLLLKIHFNMFNEKLETRKKSRVHLKRKRLSSSKVWVSTPEIKHLNKKATITVYVYNRLYNKYKNQLNCSQFNWGPIVNNIKKIDFRKKVNKDTNKQIKVKVTRKMEILREINPIYLGIKKSTYNDTKNFYVKTIRWLKLDKFIKIEHYKSNIVKLIGKDTLGFIKGLNLLKIARYNYLINQFKKELTYLRLRQKMLFNKLKFNEVYLNLLIPLLESIYKKKIELNIVLLKHYFFSSSILSQVIASKIRYKKKSNPAVTVRDSISRIYIPALSSKNLPRTGKVSSGVQNLIFNQYGDDTDKDSLNKLLLSNKKSNIWSSTYIDNLALKHLENKSVAGIYLKATGRLTKRYKAQRAVNITRYKGTLKNVYSAHKGYSSSLSKGYSNINIEKTLIHSKVRIGSFGLTGWVASY